MTATEVEKFVVDTLAEAVATGLMGRFNMGSTVILLLGPGAIRWWKTLQPGTHVRMGQSIGTLAGVS